MSLFLDSVCNYILNYNYQAAPILSLNSVSWLFVEGDTSKKKGKADFR